MVNEIVKECEFDAETPKDTVYNELESQAALYKDCSKDMGVIMAMYMLSFNTYLGFTNDRNSQH